jgi:hypothetical protein
LKKSKKCNKDGSFLLVFKNKVIMEKEINGLYDGNGNKINPLLLPVPGLCTICKSYDADDWEENLVCNMNRFDQRNSGNFKCDVFEKNQPTLG